MLIYGVRCQGREKVTMEKIIEEIRSHGIPMPWRPGTKQSLGTRL